VKQGIQENGLDIDEKEISVAAEALLSGTLEEEEEEEQSLPAPMEDIKVPVINPSKGGSKQAATDPAVEAFFKPLKRLRDEGKECHGNGKYDDGIAKYKQALVELEKLKKKSHPNIDDSEFLLREMQLNANIAVCYKQKQEAGGVITYATKVIDSAVSDYDLRLKAYKLRGFANEEIDKMKNAKADWLKVKEMQPDNIDASKALSRINSILAKDSIQEKSEEIGKNVRVLDEQKKKGNEFYKNSMLKII
jgi:tetratricopeptide (TPR) repeat protein